MFTDPNDISIDFEDFAHEEFFESFYTEQFELDPDREGLFALSLKSLRYRRVPQLDFEVIKDVRLVDNVLHYCKSKDCKPLAIVEAYALHTFGARQVGKLFEVMRYSLLKAAGVDADFELGQPPKFNTDKYNPHTTDSSEIRHYAKATLPLICSSVKRSYAVCSKARNDALKVCRVVVWLAGLAALNMYRHAKMEPSRQLDLELSDIVYTVRITVQWMDKHARLDPDWSDFEPGLKSTGLDFVVHSLEVMKMRVEDALVVEKIVLIEETIKPSIYHDEMQETARVCTVLNKPVKVAQISKKIIDDLRSALASSPWATALATDMVSELHARVNMGSKRLGMRPRLLVGPPGSGKTHIALQVAKALGVKSFVVSGGNSHDAFELGGTSKGWSGSTPSPIVVTLAEAQSNTCLIVLDEIEKATGKIGGGHLHHLLLSFLEQESAKVFRDKALQKTVDLSHVMWIATANSVGSMPASLLSRFVVCQVREPTKAEMLSLVPKILDSMCKDYGVPAGLFDGLFDVNELPGNIQNLRQLQRIVRLYAQQYFASGSRLRH